MGQKARHGYTFIFTDFTQIIETGYLYLLCEIKTGGFSTVAILIPPINTQSNILFSFPIVLPLTILQACL